MSEQEHMSELDESDRGEYECPRCFQMTHSQKEYINHLATHISPHAKTNQGHEFVEYNNSIKRVMRASRTPNWYKQLYYDTQTANEPWTNG